MAVKHAKTSAKADGADATLVQPSDWNADHTVSGGVDFPDETPATPASGTARVHGTKLAERMFLSVLSQHGHAAPLQPHIGRHVIAMILPAGAGTTTINTLGIPAGGTLGTATSLSLSTTSKLTRMQRVAYRQTTAATTNIAHYRTTPFLYLGTGTASDGGGFMGIMRGAVDTGATNASHRFFMGVTVSAAAATDVDPSTLVSMIGIGYDAADTQVQVMHNDTTGTATKVALGASFPKPSADSSNMYELTLWAPAGSTNVYWRVENTINAAVQTGTITTDLPAATSSLTPRIYTSVAGVSAVVGIVMGAWYFEKEV